MRIRHETYQFNIRPYQKLHHRQDETRVLEILVPDLGVKLNQVWHIAYFDHTYRSAYV